MPSSDEAPPPPTEAIEGAEEPGPIEADETLNAPNGDAGAASSGPEEALARGEELFNKGSTALEDGDFAEAVDCFSRALEISVAHYGELATECVLPYYKYGCALLYKAQEETDPLGNVPKGNQSGSKKDVIAKSEEDSGSLKASSGVSVSDAKEAQSSTNDQEVEEGSCDKDQEDQNEGSDDESTEADEEESDLDLAWKMLDIARAIVEKHHGDTIEKVNILASLGEVSMEREDIETSLIDYLKALSILERLVEPDNRRIVELNFMICLVLEVGSKVEEAIPYCQKAITLCNSRLQRLRENLMNSEGLPGNAVNPLSDSHKNSSNQSSAEAGADLSSIAKEIEALSGISSELEKKLEDLQQAASNPKSVLSDVMKMLASKSTSKETKVEAKSVSSSSSQMGVINCGFDSPTISTAATGEGVTHLGVVGRGIKRAVINPISAEPPVKKPLLDLPEEKVGSSTSVLDSAAQDSDTLTK